MCREMWEQSMEGMIGLISKSSPSGYTFIAERTGGSMFNMVPNNDSDRQSYRVLTG
jgi:hypothetical protein